MTKEFPRARRPREELILDFSSKHHVKCEIVQYLASHQLSGLRFLYKNYKNNKPCFLNDENGLGKIFQMVAFLSAVCNGTMDGIKVLILCQNESKLLHWNYHCSVILPNVKTIIADHQQLPADTESKNTAPCIVLSSMDHAVAHLGELKRMKYRFVIVHDAQLELNFGSLAILQALISGDSRKVIICSVDMLANTRYFYEMLKFCDQRLPLFISDAKQFLKFSEFNAKFGCGDEKGTSKRNLIFRQKNLLNVCHDFYLRRFRNEVRSILPLVDKAIYEKCFSQWKISQADTSPFEIESSCFDDDMEIPPSQDATKIISNVEMCVDLTESNRCDDYETQMSPLVYDSSESDMDDNSSVDAVRETQKVSVASLDGNRKTEAKRTKDTAASEDDGCVTKRILRSHNDKRCLRSSSKSIPNLKQKLLLQYGEEARKRPNSRQKTRKGRSNESRNSSSDNITTKKTSKSSNASKPRKPNETFTWSQETGASDIQLVRSQQMSPIIILSSSDAIFPAPNENTTSTKITPQTLQRSPDIFSSFSEHAAVDSATTTNTSPSSSPITAGQSKFAIDQNESDASGTICTPNASFASQDMGNTTNPIEALSTTTSDIFEITKNNIFHNVLKVHNSHSVTPVKSTENTTPSKTIDTPTATPTKTSFTGIRVVLPRLTSDEIFDLQHPGSRRRERAESPQSKRPSSEELIDLTADTQLNEMICSQDVIIVDDVEKTPQKKRLLTPSTRACIRRQSNLSISSDDDQPPRTPTRSPWLSKRKSNAANLLATPRSRRQLEKWFPTHAANNSIRDTSAKPRNLFQKKEPNRVIRLRSNSRSALESPSIFSSDDE